MAAAGAAIGALWLFGMLGLLERLAYFPLRDTPPAPAGIEDVWFRAEDGTRLHGWFVEARPSPGRSEPVGSVLMLHGNAGNVSHHLGFVGFLPRAGFNLLVFDYRGYGRSDRGSLKRAHMYRDAHAALDALSARDDVDPGRIVIFAQSLGAAFGSHLMADRRDVRAGVLMSAFSSWREMAASVFGLRRPGPAARTVGRFLLPAGLDPVDAIARIEERPVLLIHGTDDEIVPFAHARRLASASGPNVRLRAVEAGDHNGLIWMAPELTTEIAEFYREALEPHEGGTLPGPAAPPS